MNRRSLLGAAMALPALPAVAGAATSPDAELIRLAGEHEALGRAYNADFPDVDDDDHPLAVAAEKRREHNTEQREELMAQMMALPPTTLAGLQALAAALVVEDLSLLKDHGHFDDSRRLIALMVRGLLGMRGAA